MIKKLDDNGAARSLGAGQSIIEFTFGMVVIMFLIYGLVMVFHWAGMDLAQRSWEQENWMTTMTSDDPASELTNDFTGTFPMSAIYHGSITTNGS